MEGKFNFEPADFRIVENLSEIDVRIRRADDAWDVDATVTGKIDAVMVAGAMAALLRAVSGVIGKDAVKETLDWCLEHREEYIDDPGEENGNERDDNEDPDPGAV